MVGSMQTPIIPIGSGQTQELIAPVQDTLIAKQNYAEGQQFILGGALFTVTKSGGISVGDTINMNTDVKASDNITDQIMNMVKTANSQALTASSNRINFPNGRYIISASVQIGGTIHPLLVYPNTNGYFQSGGYINKTNGTYNQLENIEYIVNYVYVE